MADREFENLLFGLLLFGMFASGFCLLAWMSKKERGTWKFWK